VTLAALATALLLCAPAAAPGGVAGTAPAPLPTAPPADGQRAELLVRFPPWQFTGSFTLTAGGLVDHGVARDRGSLVGPDKTVERVLEGTLGTLTLTLQVGAVGQAFPPIFGRWWVSGATGAYAGLAGGGTFTSADGGLKGGTLLEVQTLLGRVVRR
jgi:hypothetical protein